MIHLPNISLFKKTGDKNRFVILDIGESSAKALVLEKNKGTEHSNFLGFGRAEFLNQDTKEIKKSSLSAINLAKMNLESKDVAFFIAGIPTRKAFLTTTTIRTTRDKPLQEITGKEMEELSEKINRISQVDAGTTLGERYQTGDIEPRLLNSDFIYTKIDGNEVVNPEGFKGEKIETSLFSTYTTKDQIDIVQNIEKTTRNGFGAYTTAMYSISKCLRKKLGNRINCTIIDIGGATTEVAVMFGGGIASSLSLRVGVNDIASLISQNLKIGINDAHKLLDMYTDNNLEEEPKAKIAKITNEVCSFWRLGIEHVFRQFSGIKVFPNEVYLCGWGSNLDEFETLLYGPWQKDIPFNADLKIHKFSSLFLDFIHNVPEKIIKKESSALSLGIVAEEIWK